MLAQGADPARAFGGCPRCLSFNFSPLFPPSCPDLGPAGRRWGTCGTTAKGSRAGSDKLLGPGLARGQLACPGTPLPAGPRGSWLVLTWLLAFCPWLSLCLLAACSPCLSWVLPALPLELGTTALLWDPWDSLRSSLCLLGAPNPLGLLLSVPPEAAVASLLCFPGCWAPDLPVEAVSSSPDLCGAALPSGTELVLVPVLPSVPRELWHCPLAPGVFLGWCQSSPSSSSFATPSRWCSLFLPGVSGSVLSARSLVLCPSAGGNWPTSAWVGLFPPFLVPFPKTSVAWAGLRGPPSCREGSWLHVAFSPGPLLPAASGVTSQGLQCPKGKTSPKWLFPRCCPHSSLLLGGRQAPGCLRLPQLLNLGTRQHPPSPFSQIKISVPWPVL